MKPLRGVFIAALAALFGCGGGSGDSPAPGGPGEGADYQVWTAWIPDAAAAEAARLNLIASNGNPSGPLWTGVEGGGTTKVFDPAAPPAAINAILIQVSSQENYNLDSVEILDAQDGVMEHASGTTWSNLVDLPVEFLGVPDGSSAHTAAVENANAFIFTRYAGPIDRFRINARGDAKAPAPGDIKSLGSFAGTIDERPGGLAVGKDGFAYTTLSLDKGVRLARFTLEGDLVGDVALETGITATEGSHSVALDKDGAIFTAVTAANGQVVVRRHHPDLSEEWKVTFSSGLGGDRVESNGLGTDVDGNVLLAGGMNSAVGGLNHWLAKLSGAGAVLVDKRIEFDASLLTYWRAVASGGGSNHIHVAGNLASASLGIIQGKVVRFGPSGNAQWDEDFGGDAGSGDMGHVIALDAAGDPIVAGAIGTLAEGRNALLIKYGSSGVPMSLATHNGVSNGDDEILDVAVDGDGSIYAVGYETMTGQGENLWVRKYSATLEPVWTRTHHGGYGNDRAISVAIHGDQVVVAGFETTSGAMTKFVLRVYAK